MRLPQLSLFAIAAFPGALIFADANQPVMESTLSTQEIQEMLGIKAWRVETSTMGERPQIIIHRKIEGQEPVIEKVELYIRRQQPSTLLLTLEPHHDGITLRAKTESENLRIPVTKLLKSPLGTKFSTTSTKPFAKDGSITFLSTTFYSSQEGNAHKKTGEVAIMIAPAK